MYQTDLCVVLRGSNYRDNDRMLTLFSRERGRIDALARGCRKQGSSLLPASDVFCCGEYQFYQKGDRFVVTQAVLKDNFFGLRKNIRALMTGTVFLEVAEKTVMRSVPNPRFFALLVNALYALEQGQNAKIVFSYFVFRLLDILGVRPVLENCVLCGNPQVAKLNIQAGGATCSHCPGKRVSQSLFADLAKLYALPPKRLAEFQPSAKEELAAWSRSWLVEALEQEPRSLKLMDAVV